MRTAPIKSTNPIGTVAKKPATIKVAINGLGRIGRLLFRYGFDTFDITLVNATSSSCELAHFLKYDSVHRTWNPNLTAQNNLLTVDQKTIPCFQEKHPDLIPWDKYKVDVVFECTGRFKNKKDWDVAFSKGVKKVIVSAPSQTADFTLVYGVNHKLYQKEKHHFISNASCTTNCLAPLVLVLKNLCGVKKGFFSTIHSYTNDQNLLDSSHKDLRRSRSACLNIIPTSTGAGEALSVIFPDLKNKLSGMAFRVPTSNVSLLDLMVEVENTTNLQEIKTAFKNASTKELKGLLAVEEAPLVSSDFIGRKESCIVDLSLIDIKDHNLLKLVAWYDNEAGFSQRMIDFASGELF